MENLGPDIIFKAIAFLVPMILSLTVHEYAHARVAWALGDDTASLQGRMSLNPLVHIDVIGTLVIPMVALFAGGLPLIGWAKPVPVSPVKFNRKFSMRTGMALTAIAGPASNFVLAMLSLLLFRIVCHDRPLSTSMGEPSAMAAIQYLLSVMVYLNMGLMIFNLLPLSPLDGSRLLPRKLDALQDRIRPYSYIILMGVVFFLGRFIFAPVWIFIMLVSYVIGIPLS
jgi:Zn-dependent protease